jgi:glyoxylase-like metal-dependent hydrolase (beta-lactamase superfamily II)
VTASSTLLIGDARIDRVVDLARFTIDLTHLFPSADSRALDADRHWLEPEFMRGDELALSIHSTVIRLDGRVILVDACVGEHKPRPKHPAWDARQGTAYLAGLAALGLTRADVDIVFCTHLHADHIGWNTVLEDGRWVPTFPNARYLIGRSELTHWQDAVAREPSHNHGSYHDSVLPVIQAGQVDLVDSDQETAHGLVVRALPGHSVGQVGISLERGGDHGVFAGDAIHHPAQLVRPDWSSRFCWDAALSRATRQDLLAAAAERGSWIIPAHFIGRVGVKVRARGEGFELVG